MLIQADWHPDIPEEYRNQIVTGDARELTKLIPDESIDLIFTDPVYDRIEDYEWLAKEAKRVLKPDSACLTFCAIGLLPDTLQALLKGGLNYRWRLIVRPVRSKEFHGRLCVMTQECLWFEKGNSKPRASIFDFQYSTKIGKFSQNNANWGKGIDALSRWIEVFSPPHGYIFDPFAGSASIPAVGKMLGRNYIAFEIDPETADIARQRILDTQPPLFTLEPEQLDLLKE